MILLVTYDLRTSGRNYASLYEALKAQGTWWHYLASTWLLDTQKTPQQVYQALAPHITTADSILIVQITNSYWGYLPNDAWEWIRTRIG